MFETSDGRIERRFRELYGLGGRFEWRLPDPLSGLERGLFRWFTLEDHLTRTDPRGRLAFGLELTRTARPDGPELRIGPVGQGLVIQRLEGAWVIELDPGYRGSVLTQLVQRALREKLTAA